MNQSSCGCGCDACQPTNHGQAPQLMQLLAVAIIAGLVTTFVDHHYARR